MNKLIELLDVASGHQNETIFAIKTNGFREYLTVGISSYEFRPETNELVLYLESDELSSIQFFGVHNVRPTEYKDVTEYTFDFDGGTCEISVEML